MIISGCAFTENKQFNYSNETIKNARKKIKEFPSLHSIVGDFTGANESNYTQNNLLMLSSMAVSSPFKNGQTDHSAELQLKKIEKLLACLIPKLKKDSRENLTSRLKDFGENHRSTMLELGLYSEFAQNPAISVLDYENIDRGDHDFYLNLDGKEFNIELTSLGKGRVQEILESAFEKAANEIIKLLPDNTMLILHVVTDMLLKEDGNNDPSELGKSLFESFKKIKQITEISRNNYCVLERNLGDGNNSLYDLREAYPFFSDFGKRLIELSKTDEGISFLKELKIREIHRCPISSFIIGDGKTKLVEIQSSCTWPSKAETLRKKSMIKQLKKRLNEKIVGEQLKGKVNPIIAVSFQDTIFHDYTSSQDLFGQQNLDELKQIIEEVFNKTKEKEILGVFLFESTIIKSQFIKNPNMAVPEDTLSKISLLAKIKLEGVAQCPT